MAQQNKTMNKKEARKCAFLTPSPTKKGRHPHKSKAKKTKSPSVVTHTKMTKEQKMAAKWAKTHQLAHSKKNHKKEAYRTKA